jgi:L-threonylcarbamoyladenylate synthase
MMKRMVAMGAEILKAGGVVAFPTETVYGLGGDAQNPRAVARIFAIKQRPHFDPLIVHIGTRDQLGQVAAPVPHAAERLMEAFWPGPLTVIVEKNPAIPDLVTSGLRGVGVRMPRNRIARDLILAAETPIAAPSANAFGGVSPTRVEHVLADLGDRIDFLIDGGACEVGIESTIISFMGPVPILLRPGGVALEDIENVVGPVTVPGRTEHEHASPGRFNRHYAPRTPLVLLESIDRVPTAERMGLLTLDSVESEAPFRRVEVLSASGDLSEAACNLFAALKRLDTAELDMIVAMPVPNVGLGRAINDRLVRAAKNRDR